MYTIFLMIGTLFNTLFLFFWFFLCSGVTPHNADRERRGPQIPDILLKTVHVHVHVYHVAATAVTLSGSAIKMIREVLLHFLTLYSNHQHHPFSQNDQN
jgi:hypothetical protein